MIEDEDWRLALVNDAVLDISDGIGDDDEDDDEIGTCDDGRAWDFEIYSPIKISLQTYFLCQYLNFMIKNYLLNCVHQF